MHASQLTPRHVKLCAPSPGPPACAQHGGKHRGLGRAAAEVAAEAEVEKGERRQERPRIEQEARGLADDRRLGCWVLWHLPCEPMAGGVGVQWGRPGKREPNVGVPQVMGSRPNGPIWARPASRSLGVNLSNSWVRFQILFMITYWHRKMLHKSGQRVAKAT
jgi:hypothetical protein